MGRNDWFEKRIAGESQSDYLALLERAHAQKHMEEIPPFRKHVDGLAGLYAWIASSAFEVTYFEKFPLLMTVGGSEVESLVSLKEDFLADGAEYLLGPPPQPSMNEHDPFRRDVFIINDGGDSMGQKLYNFLPNYGGGGVFGLPDSGMYGVDELRFVLKGGKEGALPSTLTMHGVQNWIPAAMRLTASLSSALMRYSNANVYIARQGQEVGMHAHNDLQCVFIFQVQGRKRWRIWLSGDLALNIMRMQTVGPDKGNRPRVERLGKPDVDIVLEPGSVLYIPRGAIHLTSTTSTKTTHDISNRTSTNLEQKSSLHITASVEVGPAINAAGKLDTLNYSLGALAGYHGEEVLVTQFRRQLRKLFKINLASRTTVPPSMMLRLDKLVWRAHELAGKYAREEKKKEDEALLLADLDRLRRRTREIMHQAVDMILSDGTYMDTMLSRFSISLQRSRSQMKEQFRKQLRAVERGELRDGGGHEFVWGNVLDIDQAAIEDASIS